MGVLIALPGVLATVLLAPWVLRIFYSKDFVAAAGIIRWQVIGVFLRVVCWPIGAVLIAKGKSKLFMATESIYAIINVALLYVCTKVWGLTGIGVAFALFYVEAKSTDAGSMPLRSHAVRMRVSTPGAA